MRSGSTGTSMTVVKRPYPVGPQLKLPPSPKRSEYFTKKQIFAEAERLTAGRQHALATEMQGMVSWEDALTTWNVACEEARKAHREKVKKWQDKRRDEKANRAKKWQETIDYCAANGLPLPHRWKTPPYP